LSEQDPAGILIQKLAQWEQDIRSSGMDRMVEYVNALHRDVGLRLRQTALDIWGIGRVLKWEKEMVEHGNWIDHCKRCHREISIDSIERYMRIAEIPIDQLPIILEKTPRQAYLMLGILKKRPSLPGSVRGQDRWMENSAYVRNLKKALTLLPIQITCPLCYGMFRVKFREP